MALRRAHVLLILLLLAEWTSGLAAMASAAVASDHRPRMNREVYPIAARYSRQLHEQIALPPLLSGESIRLIPEPTPAARPYEVPPPSPPADGLLFSLLALLW